MANEAIALCGATGQVGSAVKARADQCNIVNGRFTDTMEPVLETLDRVRPTRLINAAAYTAVDQAESDRKVATLVNAHAPSALAAWCANNACLMVHFSTDYVFDGSAARPYQEMDSVHPINAYGLSKRQGEVAIFSHRLAGVILRTSWVMGVEGHNFVHTMLRLGQEREELAVVNDQWGRPTSADLLAEVAVTVTDTQAPTMALYHVSDAGEPTTWHAIACYALDRARDFGYRGLTSESVRPVSSADFKTTARRPANSLLDCSRFDRVIGIPRQPWQHTVDRIVEHALRA